MAKKRYTLTVQPMKDGKHEYFMGKVMELKGLTIYGKTEEEVVNSAPSMIIDFVKALDDLKAEKKVRQEINFIRQPVCA